MPKFKIGDEIMAKGCGDKVKYVVLSIIEETCYAGKQIHYFCRAYVKEYKPFGKEGESWYPAIADKSNELKKFSEIELIPYKPNESSEP